MGKPILNSLPVLDESAAFYDSVEPQYRIVNGLGADITQLWYADEEGRLHTASSVAAGSEVTLKRSTDSLAPAEQRKPWREIYVSNWIDLSKSLSGRRTLNSAVPLNSTFCPVSSTSSVAASRWTPKAVRVRR